jgi:hypothetical protein
MAPHHVPLAIRDNWTPTPTDKNSQITSILKELFAVETLASRDNDVT